MVEFLKIKSAQELVSYFRGLDRKTKIQLGFAAGGGVFFLAFIFWPAWIGRLQVQSQIQLLRNSLTSAQLQIQLEPRLLEQQKQVDAFIREAHGRLLTEDDTQRLTGILTQMSERSRTSLLASQPETQAQAIPAPFDQQYGVRSYLLAVEGGYHALAALISEIENHPKILRVDELSIMSRDEKPGVLVGEIRLSAFFKREGGS